MTDNKLKLESDSKQVQRLVPADDSSSRRFESVQYHGDDVPGDISPDTEPDGNSAAVSGRLLVAIPEAVTAMSGSFEQFTREIMADADTGPIRADDWYDQETALAVIGSLEERGGGQVVERVGRFLPELLPWDTDVPTFTAALEGFGDWYRTWHRSGPETFTVRSTGEMEVELTLATPYPDEFERGLVRGLVHQFPTGGTNIWTTVDGAAADGQTVYRFTVREDSNRPS